VEYKPSFLAWEPHWFIGFSISYSTIEIKFEPPRREGREDFVFFLIRETDQVNHHALTGNNLSSQYKDLRDIP